MREKGKQGRRFSPENGKAPRENVSRRELRKDPEFAKELASRWGLGAPPESFRRGMQALYRELPDELPVKRDPVRQALKGLAAAAAVFGAVCAGLFALNAAQPQIAEALPGVGGVFQALNQPKEEPSPTPQATPTPDSGESQVTEGQADGDALDVWGEKIAPDFAPVEIQGEGGTLWVDRAWSDGVSLVLDLRLELGDYGVSLYQQAPELELVPAYGEVTLNGQIVASGETLQDYAAQDMVCGHQIEPFTWDGDGALTGRWVLDLAALGEDATASGECQVTLAMDELTAQSLREDELVDLEASGLLQQVGGFVSDSFPVPVVRDYNTIFQGGATDNGASLQGVSFAPTQLAVALEMPFLGKTSYCLQPEYSLRAAGGADTMAAEIGYAGVVAATESGRTLQLDLGSLIATGGAGNYDPYQVSCAFTGLYPGEDQVTLTLYDASQVKRCYDDSGTFTGADPGLFRVAASFTLDLTAGTADLNWDYLEEGYERLDADTYPADSGNFLGDFTNGFYVGNCQLETDLVANGSRTGPCQLVTLFTGDLDYRPVTLVAYAGEESYTVWSQDPTALNSYDQLAGVYYHQEESGEYWESVTGQEAFGGTYRVMEFRVYYPTELLDGQGRPFREFDKFSLLDGETGEVLIEDISAALAQQRAQVTGDGPVTGEPEASPQPAGAASAGEVAG